jgi:hypothetical protein
LTFSHDYVQSNIMGIARLQDALERLTTAIRDVETELAAMKAEHDPLASHIFVSRRHYRNANGTKGGKRRRNERTAKFQHSLRTRLSREFGRMGAVDACGCATVIAAVHTLP